MVERSKLPGATRCRPPSPTAVGHPFGSTEIDFFFGSSGWCCRVDGAGSVWVASCTPKNGAVECLALPRGARSALTLTALLVAAARGRETRYCPAAAYRPNLSLVHLPPNSTVHPCIARLAAGAACAIRACNFPVSNSWFVCEEFTVHDAFQQTAVIMLLDWNIVDLIHSVIITLSLSLLRLEQIPFSSAEILFGSTNDVLFCPVLCGLFVC